MDTSTLSKKDKLAFWLEIMGATKSDIVEWKQYKYIRTKNPITSDEKGRTMMQRVYLPESLI